MRSGWLESCRFRQTVIGRPLTLVSDKTHSHLPCIKPSALSKPLHGFHDLRTSSLYLRSQLLTSRESTFDIPLIDISPPFLRALPGRDCSSRPSILCTRHIWIVVLLVSFSIPLDWYILFFCVSIWTSHLQRYKGNLFRIIGLGAM